MNSLTLVGADDDGCRYCNDETKRLLDRMFQVLPAPSAAVIGARLNISPQHVHELLMHLRRRSHEHGWTVPHVRRGRTTEQDRYIVVLVERDGTYLDANTGEAVELGLLGTAESVAAMCDNEARALRAAAGHVKSRNDRERLEDCADDFAYVSRKGVKLIRDMRGRDDGTATGG